MLLLQYDEAITSPCAGAFGQNENRIDFRFFQPVAQSGYHVGKGDDGICQSRDVSMWSPAKTPA